MTKKKLKATVKKPTTKKTEVDKPIPDTQFREFRVELALHEKTATSSKKKHTKAIKIVSTEKKIKKLFREYKNRDKEELRLSIYEVGENGRSKRKAIMTKQIFPVKQIKYTDIVKSFDSHHKFGQITNRMRPLFRYFLRINEINEDHEVRYTPAAYQPYAWKVGKKKGWRSFDVSLARNPKEIKKLWLEWSTWLYGETFREKIVAAVTDPLTKNVEDFKELLEEMGFFRKVISECDNYALTREPVKDIKSITDDFYMLPVTLIDKKTGTSITLSGFTLDNMLDKWRDNYY